MAWPLVYHYHQIPVIFTTISIPQTISGVVLHLCFRYQVPINIVITDGRWSLSSSSSSAWSSQITIINHLNVWSRISAVGMWLPMFQNWLYFSLLQYSITIINIIDIVKLCELKNVGRNICSVFDWFFLLCPAILQRYAQRALRDTGTLYWCIYHSVRGGKANWVIRSVNRYMHTCW